MATTIISPESKLATGINVFVLPQERQAALLETLGAINREILLHKFPMNVSANFHRAIDASIIINYNQYTDRASGQYLRTRSETAPLLKRTHDLSEIHEIRWYEVADVVAADGSRGQIEISDDRGDLAVIGIFTVEAGKQGELLDLLKRYGETLKGAKAAGFIGIAVHRGYQGTHAAIYEQWASIDAYRNATREASTARALQQIRDTANVSDLHLYHVESVTRFDLNS